MTCDGKQINHTRRRKYGWSRNPKKSIYLLVHGGNCCLIWLMRTMTHNKSSFFPSHSGNSQENFHQILRLVLIQTLVRWRFLSLTCTSFSPLFCSLIVFGQIFATVLLSATFKSRNFNLFFAPEKNSTKSHSIFVTITTRINSLLRCIMWAIMYCAVLASFCYLSHDFYSTFNLFVLFFSFEKYLKNPAKTNRNHDNAF